ncbi:hypothetical protein GCM10009609_39220 [Pseudonocardia aurantiaca]
MKLRMPVVLAAVVAATATACGGAAPAPGARELTVFAAASLTETFSAMERQFEAENPGVDDAPGRGLRHPVTDPPSPCVPACSGPSGPGCRRR